MRIEKIVRRNPSVKMKVLLSALFLQFTLSGQTVYTFAGSGLIGSADGAGGVAGFNHPSGVALDAAGNIYVADYWNHKIRKITPSGVVSTLAGSGSPGTTNGTGSAASFNYPHGLVVDASGNVFVADRNNHKIRKVTSSGVVSTLAGSGTGGGSDGTGAAASFNLPVGVAVDPIGNVYVADGSYKIRKITSGGVVTTLAGSGSIGSANGTGAAASFNNPQGVAVDNLGNVFVTDYGNHKIRKVTSAGVVTNFAGSGIVGSVNGTGISASFSSPSAITMDGSGNLFVAEGSNKVRKITSAGVVTTFAGSGINGYADGPALTANFGYVNGIASNNSGETIYISAYDYHKIRRILSCFSTPPPAPTVNVTQPTSIAPTGNIAVTSPTGSFEYSIDDINYQTGTSFTGLGFGIYQVTARQTASIGCISSATTVTITPATSTQSASGTICAGSVSSLYICNDGSLMSWGSNNDGQLGNGTNGAAFESYVPIPVSFINGVTAIYGGWGWEFAIKNDGTVWAWGSNTFGCLGNGTTTSSNIPVLISSLTGVAAIGAAPSSLSPLALKTDGTVLAWGSNGSGQLGNGTTTSSYLPVIVNSLSGVTAVATGADYSMALKNNGTVWAWGNNLYGQFGNGTNTGSSIPIQINGLSNVSAIKLASNTTAVLKSNGTVWSCGSNSNGELGNGTSLNSNVPVQITALTGITSISAGNNFFLALKNDGTVWAWGRNNAGQLGIGTLVNSNIAVQVNGLTNVTSISAGAEYSHAIKSDGTIWSWGSNGSGQLGNGTATGSKSPVQMSGLCNGVTGLTENPINDLTSIYPNPSSGIFQLILGNLNLDGGTMEVYNACGEKIYATSTINQHMQIDLSLQSKGIYVIKIYGGTSVYSKKIIFE